MARQGLLSPTGSCRGKRLPPGSPREQGRDLRGIVGYFVRRGGYFGGGGLDFVCLKYGGSYIP
ncbi:unnamed protein product [Ectocarpus fasciculatus]